MKVRWYFSILVVLLLALMAVFGAGCVSTDTSQGEITDNQTEEESQAPITDYTNLSNWLRCEVNPTQAVDTFFIYPTVIDYATTSERRAEITDEMRRKATLVSDLMATAFGNYTNLYAPYYRQVPLDQLEKLKTNEMVMKTLRGSDAKEDIFAALDEYFEKYNNGRPFILAGHSQGSALTLIVLEEYMKLHPEYYKNMVAAYPLGFGFNQEWLDANPHLKFASGESDTGVIIGFNVEGPNGTGRNILLPEHSLNINPLNWKTDETYAPASLNKGENISYLSVRSDAQINKERGVVVSTRNTNYLNDSMSLDLFGNVSLHGAEYFDYYGNIRENGKKRVQAFLSQNQDKSI